MCLCCVYAPRENTKSRLDLLAITMLTVIYVTQDDIEKARRRSFEDPISYAFQRATGTTWRMFELKSAQVVAIEAVAPYRTAILSGEVLERWQDYKAMNSMLPFEFSTEFTDGYC